MTPVLESLHPSSILDSLHCQCSSSVKSQNKLKETSQTEAGDSTLDKSKGQILKTHCIHTVALLVFKVLLNGIGLQSLNITNWLEEELRFNQAVTI